MGDSMIKFGKWWLGLAGTIFVAHGALSVFWGFIKGETIWSGDDTLFWMSKFFTAWIIVGFVPGGIIYGLGRLASAAKAKREAKEILKGVQEEMEKDRALLPIDAFARWRKRERPSK